MSDRVLKVATPLMAFTVTVPLSVEPPGLVPMATVIEALLVVTVLPPASWTVTWIAGLMLAPAAAVLGWTLKASWVAEPTLMLKVLLVAPVRPPLEAVSV